MWADEVPVAHTPPGGHGAEVPAPILEGCTESLVSAMAVTRRLDGAQLVWDYGPLFTARLERVG